MSFSVIYPGVALITAVCVQCTLLRFVQHVSFTFQWEVWLPPRWLTQNEHVTRCCSWLAAGRLSGAEPRCDWWPVCRWRAGREMCDTRAKSSNAIPDRNRKNTEMMPGIRWQDATCTKPARLLFLRSHFQKPPQNQWHSLCSPRSRRVP